MWPKTTQTNYAHFLTRAHLPVAERRIGRDARTQQWRHASRVELVRYLQDKRLINNNALGITAICYAAEYFVFRVVSEYRNVLAILFKPFLTAITNAARAHETTDSGEIACFEFCDCTSYFRDTAHDFMTGHARVNGWHYFMPLIAHLMKIRVADTAI